MALSDQQRRCLTSNMKHMGAYLEELGAKFLQLRTDYDHIAVLDAKGFFYQWRVKPGHRERLAVISHRGQEYFKVAIMGYRNSVAYVQRQIDLILKDFFKWCRTYLDDIVVCSNSLHEHIYIRSFRPFSFSTFQPIPLNSAGNLIFI